CLGLNELHVRPAHGLADCLCVGSIVLLSLDVRLHVGWRHEPHTVAERLKFTRPVMRRGAGLDANQAWRQLLEEGQHVSPLQPAADEDIAFRIDPVNLKDRLCDIEADCRNRLHRLAPLNRGRHPDRFLFGSDVVTPKNIDAPMAVYNAYEPLWKALRPETVRKVALENYERIF